MSVTTQELFHIISQATAGLCLAELQSSYPAIARRTLQRNIAKLIDAGQIKAVGDGRARRYFLSTLSPIAAATLSDQQDQTDSFPAFIPLSADSADILAYIDQPVVARKPVGYQRDFLEAYEPNLSSHLPDSLCRLLHEMVKTTKLAQPADQKTTAVLF